MRERLIELLRDTFNYTKGVCIDFDEAVEINADYLIENGVVVPPCKVGDKVYRISGNFRGEKIYEGTVDQIVVHDNGEVVFFVYGHPLRFNKYDIGKTVFFNREEAERALRKDDEGK